MRVITVLISWIRMSMLDMAAFAHKIVLHMTDNTNFPKPKVDLSEMADAATRLETAYGNRKNGSKAKFEMEAAHAALNEILYEQAEYVDEVAKGSAVIIDSSGFEPTKGHRAPSTIPASPPPVKLTAQTGGILHMTTTKPIGAESILYVVFLGTDSFPIAVQDNHIILPPSSIRTIVIAHGGVREDLRGLTPGMEVKVQALAQNSAGMSAFSPLVSTFIV